MEMWTEPTQSQRCVDPCLVCEKQEGKEKYVTMWYTQQLNSDPWHRKCHSQTQVANVLLCPECVGKVRELDRVIWENEA